MTAARKAVFVDKDGTLVVDVPYNVDPGRLRFTPGALPALRGLQAAGYALLVVSNQPGLALGRFDAPAWERLRAALLQRLQAEGIVIDGLYWCGHAPGAGCGCRKPAAGLLRQAAKDHRLDLARSWMVGDILDDVEAGRRAGCRAILLDVGHETVWEPGPDRVPVYRAADLLDAAGYIVTCDDRALIPALSQREREVAPSPLWGEGRGEGPAHHEPHAGAPP